MKTTVKNKSEKEVITKRYSLYWGDNCKVVPQLPDESIGLCIHSPPFSDLFSYSDSIEDMGNSRNYEEFFTHYGFLIKELERVMLPGRIVAVHCMDLPTHKTDGEEIGISDFPGDIIRCFIEHGFIFHSRFCVWKDPLIAAVRTKAIGLAHKQIIKDSVMCRTGIPDYILAFRKKGENPKPVPHPKGLTEYAGARSIPKELYRYANVEDQRKNKFSHWIWQQYASPVWFDIRQTRVLPFRKARDNDDEKHICPFARDTVIRCLELWSTKGDIVLDPFLGVGTTVYEAVRLGRKGVGVELKGSYFRQAVKNLESLELSHSSKGFEERNGKK